MESTQGGPPLSLLETGRIATRQITNAGASYLHPYDDSFESLQERVGLDEWGQHIIVEPTEGPNFFSIDQGTTYGRLTTDAIHGEVLKLYLYGLIGVQFFNTEHDIGGPWDEIRTTAREALEDVVEQGLFINPADGDVAGGNMGFQVD